MDERLVSSEADNHESVIEQSLRPQNLAQYIGQHKVKENLRVFIDAAKMRQETLDHVLLYGPPGLGKQRLLRLLLMKWEWNCGRHQGLRLKGLVIWLLY